jgi:hypothetical protein
MSNNLDTIRTSYFSGQKTQIAAEEFNILMEGVNTNTPVLKAYFGAAIALKAKYGGNIREKREFFEQAVEHIEAAIQADSNNPEIRLIRLSVQENSPRIVKYKDNMDEDKAFILEHFASQSTAVKRCIRDYVSNSDFFNEEEKSSILD